MAGRADYEERKQAKIDRLEEAAYKARKEANGAFERSSNLVKDIPLGQPNIRGALTGVMNKSRNAMDRSCKMQDKADYLDSKLTAVSENNAISSDDPNSLEKLQAKIDKLTKQKEFYKSVNAYHRKHGTCKGFEGITEEQAAELDKNAKYCLNCGKPVASFELTSLNQKIKSAQERIDKIKAVEQMPEELIKYNFCEIESNAETNRVTINFYERQPEEVTQKLKSWGYKWAYTDGVWQRLRTPGAWRLTKQLVEEFKKMI